MIIALVGALIGTSVALPANADPGTGPGSLSGHVTAAGVPLEGISVTTYSSATWASASATTDATGYYEITGLDLGDHWVNVSVPAEYQWANVPMLSITTESLSAVRDIALEPWPVGTGSIAGTVIDSVTLEPIPGAWVSLSGMDLPYYSSTSSDAVGAYSFANLPEASYSVFFGASGYVSQQVNVIAFSDQTLILDRALAASNSAISGHVHDAAGNPVADLWVNARPEADYFGGSAVTDASGDFSISSLGAGNYTVSLGGRGTSWVLQEISVTAIANEAVSIDVTVAPRLTGSIHGYALSTEGFAVQNYCTSLYDASTGLGVAGSRQSPAEGTFAIDDLDPGDYKLLFWDCEYTRTPAYAMTFWGGGALLSLAETITVAPGEEVNLGEMTLGRGGSISGHIAVETADGQVELWGNHAMDASVFQLVDGVLEELPDPSPFVGLGGIGDYTVSGLPAGEYVVGFVDSTYYGVRAYATEYWDNVTNPTAGTPVVVTSGESVTDIDALVSMSRPIDDPVATPTESLPSAGENVIDSADTAAQGATISVAVGAEYAGEWISVWGHSTPTLLNSWVQVTSAGTVSVTVPTALAIGAHTLVAQTADSAVIGWTPVSITAPLHRGKGNHYAYGHYKVRK